MIRDRAISLLFPFVILAVQIPIVIYFMLFLILLGTANLNISHFVASAGDIITASSSYVDQISSLTGGGPVNLTRVVVNGTLLGSNGTIAGMQIPPDSRWVAYGVLLYFLFGVLWVLESSRNVGWTALSGSYSDWYFFRSLSPPSTALHHPPPPSTTLHHPPHPPHRYFFRRDPLMKSRCSLAASLCRVIRYHLGTIFFGSFIIALIQLIRIVMAIIDKQTQRLQEGNKMLKLAMKCVQLCMWCFEKTVKFITNYCYIYVAMQGSGFCKSCFAVFSLILGNPAQLALNTLVRNILSLIQMIAIPAACGWGCHQVLSMNNLPGTHYTLHHPPPPPSTHPTAAAPHLCPLPSPPLHPHCQSQSIPPPLLSLWPSS